MGCRIHLAAVAGRVDSVHKVVDYMIAAGLRHREALDLDSRLVTDREAAEVDVSTAAVAGHIHPVQATDIQR
jgi:hypothetical protein